MLDTMCEKIVGRPEYEEYRIEALDKYVCFMG